MTYFYFIIFLASPCFSMQYLYNFTRLQLYDRIRKIVKPGLSELIEYTVGATSILGKLWPTLVQNNARNDSYLFNSLQMIHSPIISGGKISRLAHTPVDIYIMEQGV